jgi:CHAT domain-containing protein
MILRGRFSENIFCILILSVIIDLCEGPVTIIASSARDWITPPEQPAAINIPSDLATLNNSLRDMLMNRNYDSCYVTVGTIIRILTGSRGVVDENILFDSYYFIGIYYSYTSDPNQAINFLKKAVEIGEKNRRTDARFSKALFNLGTMYSRLGDFNRHEQYSLKALEIDRTIYGIESPDLISTYLSLISAYIDLQEYEKAIDFSNTALGIAEKNNGKVLSQFIANLYNNLGVCYIRLEDYSRAKLYLEKSEAMINTADETTHNDYINILNNLAIACAALGLSEKSDIYYEKGISIALLHNSPITFNLINSYAISLGNKGRREKGEAMLSDAVRRAERVYGTGSRNYFATLIKYADYLREYQINNSKALDAYKICADYINKNVYDLSLKTNIYTGYSLSLSEAGDNSEALELIQKLLFPVNERSIVHGLYDNPSPETFKADKRSLKILQTKYRILQNICRKSREPDVLENAGNTSELIIYLLEKIRINISEEESRLILGDRYRNSYLNAIHDFYRLYKETGKPQYLEKAFEYSEKSKVAGLLASVRELKASQLKIPADIGKFEKNLQRDISYLNAKIAEESALEKQDTLLLAKLKENLLQTTRKRDSLVLIFEKNYPGYYSIKYNTSVAGLKDIAKITGKSRSYVNYILSDTLLYIFVANSRYREMLTIPVDSSFFKSVRQFRGYLTYPKVQGDVRGDFEAYKTTGFMLYKVLIEPVRKYLVNGKLLISPDNILSYLPFESLLTSPESKGDMIYRNLHYLLFDFDISYTYSATYLRELAHNNKKFSHYTAAFAPDYNDSINIQPFLVHRQAGGLELNDLPYARKEAEYISRITKGKLFLGGDATESSFKNESGKFDMIHLAMHTIINDNYPMQSALIFSHKKNETEDGFLNTYEVYGLPLKARMIVLSSCNSGTGRLYSGEGILSLARSFIFSGCQSVVMSLWEIEDKSGTDIVKLFYDNLKKGYSKSMAMKKARIEFIRNADQLKSHPYHWSTLVIYGDNAPLYNSRVVIIAAAAGIIILLLIIFLHFRRSRYS